MIITKEIEVIVNNNRISLYRQYFPDKIIKQGDKIKIPIKLLSHNSRLKIDAKCDICEKEKKVTYINYMKSFNNCGVYCCCAKCSSFKNEKTNIERYGVKHHLLLDEYKEKFKTIIIEKYGIENISQLDEIFSNLS